MGQEKAGLVDEAAIKAVGAFGGGIAATGGVCGTLLGGVALISNLYSRGNLDEKEDVRMWTLSKKFIAGFEELTAVWGGSDCRAIAKVDWQNREAVRDYYSNPESRRKICVKLVGDAALLLGKILEEGAQSGAG